MLFTVLFETTLKTFLCLVSVEALWIVDKGEYSSAIIICCRILKWIERQY